MARQSEPVARQPRSGQIGAAFREFYEGPALVHHQPAALYRQVETGLVFVRRTLLAVQERPVDQLDVDPPS